MLGRPALSRRKFIQRSLAAGAGLGATKSLANGGLANPAPLTDDTEFAGLDDDYGPAAAGDKNPAARPSFRNWTGNIRCRPQRIERPRTLAELQDLVGAATQVKAVGSGHSFTPCAVSDTLMLQTDALSGILDVDAERGLVTVLGGTKLHALNTALVPLGLALPSLGDIDRQSVAGAIATGTHGTGMQWGSLSDQESVHALGLVTADGNLRQLSADRPEDQALLRAARVGLGALGIVYSVTLKTVPAHRLLRHSQLIPLADALDPRHYRDNDHFEFFRFPFTDLVQAVSRNRTGKPADMGGKGKTFFDKIVLENGVLGAVLNLTALRPQLLPRVMPLIAACVPTDDSVNRSDKAMVSRRLVRAYEIEYAIPLAKLPEMHARYADVVRRFATRDTAPFFASFPCENRFVRADRGTLLSPSAGQDVCFFSAMSHIAFPGYEPFLRAMEVEMLAVGGRPHWGKLFYQNPAPLYPQFGEFLAWRRQLDPQNKFVNVYIERLMSGQDMVNQTS